LTALFVHPNKMWFSSDFLNPVTFSALAIYFSFSGTDQNCTGYLFASFTGNRSGTKIQSTPGNLHNLDEIVR